MGGETIRFVFLSKQACLELQQTVSGVILGQQGKLGLQVSLVPPEKAAGSVGLGASAQMGGGEGPAPSSFHLQVQPPGSSEGPTVVASPETRSRQPRPVLCSEPARGCGRTALGRLGDPLRGTAEVFPDPLLRSSPEPALTAHGTCGVPHPNEGRGWGSAHSGCPKVSSAGGFSRFIQMGFSSQEEAWSHSEVSSD